MPKISIGSVEIPLEDYAICGTALLGIRGAGKTVTAKRIAEQLLDHEIPIVAFDPIGQWKYLRQSSGKRGGRGYKIVVAGGADGDLPLTRTTAPQIVRAAIRENIPLVIDLYDKRLSKADWRKIVQECFRTLMYENVGVRHIFLEETAEFAPQKVTDGQTYAEVEKVVRMGGNASLGITLINQRSQEVNKAVLDLCENLVLHRQRGSHAIDALTKWLDKLSPDFAKEISKGMPSMKAGEAWVFLGDSDTPVHTRSELTKSFHPDRKRPQVTKQKAKRADAADFVSRLSGELETLIDLADQDDPAKLKKKIAELENQLKAKAPKVELSKQQTNALERLKKEIAKRDEVIEQYKIRLDETLETYDKLKSLHDDLSREVDQLARQIRIEVDNHKSKHHLPQYIKTSHPAQSQLKEVKTDAPVETRLRQNKNKPLERRSENSGTISKGERKLLVAIGQFPAGLSYSHLRLLTDYKKSSIDTYLTKLRSKGLVAHGQPYKLTFEGIGELGSDFEPLPTGEDLRVHYLNSLGGGERAIFDLAINEYPNELTTENLKERLSYTDSSISTYLTKLKARGLISASAGTLRANDHLFD